MDNFDVIPDMNRKLEEPKTEPVLVSHFSDIREDPGINPKIDDFQNTFEGEEYRRHFFEEAKKAFEFIFDKEKFIQSLQLPSNPESFFYLKQIRRYGLVLKASYNFSDSSHVCGEKLNTLLFLLGEYNDSYWVAPNTEIRGKILSNLGDIDLSINLVSTPEFKRYTEDILAQIEVILQKTELPIRELHLLRRRLRLISNFLQVAAAEDCGGNSHWLFYSIFRLSAKLGELHDYYVQKQLRGEIEYDKSVVKIDLDIKTQFEYLKPFIRKICGLD